MYFVFRGYAFPINTKKKIENKSVHVTGSHYDVMKIELDCKNWQMDWSGLSCKKMIAWSKGNEV